MDELDYQQEYLDLLKNYNELLAEIISEESVRIEESNLLLETLKEVTKDLATMKGQMNRVVSGELDLSTQVIDVWSYQLSNVLKLLKGD